ncbi:hypothetical protein EV283_3098 [Sphingomonas sp. BK036]|nr:hypothetical protein EV283_3098 [Sphingomonas sp. BK036]
MRSPAPFFFLVPPRKRGPKRHVSNPNLAGPPRPRGNGNGIKTSHTKTTTPAQAGAQLGNLPLAHPARAYFGLPIWAPAFAGVDDTVGNA